MKTARRGPGGTTSIVRWVVGTLTRIGILGGTFDPVHVAHLVAANVALHEARLDLVLLMVANDPWQKSAGRTITAAEVRFAAVASAIENVDGLEASRIEIDRGGPSYTAETLEALSRVYPSSSLFLIGGTDSVSTIETWHRAEDIANLAEILVVDRPGAEFKALGSRWRVRRIEMPALDLSSTDLHRRMATGHPVDFLIPEKSLDQYRASGLYP